MNTSQNNHPDKKESDEFTHKNENARGKQNHPGSGVGDAVNETSDEVRKKMLGREAPFPGGAEEAAGTEAAKKNNSGSENNQIGASPSVGDEILEDPQK